ncbi:MAG: hypothetical protein Tsb0014_23490 [Pleurocapsa sp.]
MTGAIEIRPATADDVLFMEDTIWEALKVFPNLLHHMGIEAAKKQNQEYWQTWLNNSDPAFIATDSCGKRLGVLTLRPNYYDIPGSSWRIGLSIGAEFRRQGIGKKLLEFAAQYGQKQRASYLNLFVDPSNAAAISLYKKMKFKVVGNKNSLIEMRRDIS